MNRTPDKTINAGLVSVRRHMTATSGAPVERRIQALSMDTIP